MDHKYDRKQSNGAGNVPPLQSQRIECAKGTRFNARLFFIVLVSGLIGCVPAVFCYAMPSVSQPFRAFSAFAALSACLFFGAMVGEQTAPRNIGYGNRRLILAILCAGIVLLSAVAALFQAMYGVGSTVQSGSLALIVDRSGSMNGNNDAAAKKFLDALSSRIPAGKEVELYQFENTNAKRNLQRIVWSSGEPSISTRLDDVDGLSDFSGELQKMADHQRAVVVLITDCNDIESYVNKAVINKIKENNQFVVVQLSSVESEKLRSIADEYLCYQDGDSDEKIASFFKTSRVFAWQGLLTPAPGEPVAAAPLIMLAVLGGIMGFAVYLAFGCSGHLRFHVFWGVLAGILCRLILHIPLSLSFLPENWQGGAHTFLSLLPFCLMMSRYAQVQYSVVHDGLLLPDGRPDSSPDTKED